MATFMADYELFQIEITKNYTTVEWRDDLKRVWEQYYMIHKYAYHIDPNFRGQKFS